MLALLPLCMEAPLKQLLPVVTPPPCAPVFPPRLCLPCSRSPAYMLVSCKRSCNACQQRKARQLMAVRGAQPLVRAQHCGARRPRPPCVACLRSRQEVLLHLPASPPWPPSGYPPSVLPCSPTLCKSGCCQPPPPRPLCSSASQGTAANVVSEPGSRRHLAIAGSFTIAIQC